MNINTFVYKKQRTHTPCTNIWQAVLITSNVTLCSLMFTMTQAKISHDYSRKT